MISAAIVLAFNGDQDEFNDRLRGLLELAEARGLQPVPVDDELYLDVLDETARLVDTDPGRDDVVLN